MRTLNMDLIGHWLGSKTDEQLVDLKMDRSMYESIQSNIYEWLDNSKCQISLPIEIQLRLLGWPGKTLWT